MQPGSLGRTLLRLSNGRVHHYSHIILVNWGPIKKQAIRDGPVLLCFLNQNKISDSESWSTAKDLSCSILPPLFARANYSESVQSNSSLCSEWNNGLVTPGSLKALHFSSGQWIQIPIWGHVTFSFFNESDFMNRNELSSAHSGLSMPVTHFLFF